MFLKVMLDYDAPQRLYTIYTIDQVGNVTLQHFKIFIYIFELERIKFYNEWNKNNKFQLVYYRLLMVEFN